MVPKILRRSSILFLFVLCSPVQPLQAATTLFLSPAGEDPHAAAVRRHMLTPGDQQTQGAVPPGIASEPPPLKKVTSQLASAQETFGVEFQEVQENGVRGLYLKGARAGSAMARVGLMPGLLVSLNGQRVSGAADVARVKKEATEQGVLTFDWEIDPRFRPSYTGKTFTPVEPNPKLGIRRDRMVSGDNIYMCCEVRKISSKEKVIAQRRLLVLTDRVMFTTDLSSGDKKVLDVKPVECVALILLQRGCTPDNQILIQMARQQNEFADMHFHFVGSADNSPPNVTVQDLCQCIKVGHPFPSHRSTPPFNSI